MRKIALTEDNGQPTGAQLAQLQPQLLAAAQQIYNKWDDGLGRNKRNPQDLGKRSDGICDEIAHAWVDVLENAGFKYAARNSVKNQFPEDPPGRHSYTSVLTQDGIYGINIPYTAYETLRPWGLGFAKIPNVNLGPQNMAIKKISKGTTPQQFIRYSGGGRL